MSIAASIDILRQARRKLKDPDWKSIVKTTVESIDEGIRLWDLQKTPLNPKMTMNISNLLTIILEFFGFYVVITQAMDPKVGWGLPSVVDLVMGLLKLSSSSTNDVRRRIQPHFFL